jgi:hypothetical protein
MVTKIEEEIAGGFRLVRGEEEESGEEAETVIRGDQVRAGVEEFEGVGGTFGAEETEGEVFEPFRGRGGGGVGDEAEAFVGFVAVEEETGEPFADEA